MPLILFLTNHVPTSWYSNKFAENSQLSFFSLSCLPFYNKTRECYRFGMAQPLNNYLECKLNSDGNLRQSNKHYRDSSKCGCMDKIFKLLGRCGHGNIFCIMLIGKPKWSKLFKKDVPGTGIPTPQMHLFPTTPA
jgi:hypothetical protein